MFFLQAAEAPLIVKYDKKILRVRKFSMKEVVEWGAEIMASRIDEATADMSPGQKREFLTVYPPVPPDLGEMKRRLRTPEGIDRVLNACLPDAEIIDKARGGRVVGKLSEDEIESIMNVNGTGRKAALAWELGDLDDSSLTRDPSATGANGNEDENEDPLT